jgi:hypothetical protein
LRHQVAVYKRALRRPRLRTAGRLFWVGLTRVWAGRRQSLLFVTPETVLRWQRRRFREHWTKLSARPKAGRPPVHAEIVALVRKWPQPIRCGGRPESMGSSASSGLMWPSAPSPGPSRSRVHPRLRPGAPSSRTMSRAWSR